MAKILVVENEAVNREMIIDDLRLQGYEVVVAEDGQQGLDMASSQSPNIILLDMSLPVVDGWDVARQLKAASNTKDIPIIALTAHAMEGDRKRSLEAGCDDYETKPYKIERLIEKIEQILGLA